MNINNLSVGKTYKNYKELCEVLEIEPKSSNSKKSQLKELERFVLLKKEGIKYTIEEIYKEPKEIDDDRSKGNNTAPYVDDIELLLIDLLLCAKNEELKIPKTALLKALNIVNYNYGKYFGDLRPILAKGLNLKLEHVNDYLENVSAALNNHINTVIRRLVRKKLIVHKEITMVKVIEAVANEYTRNGKPKIKTKTYTDEYGIERVEYIAPKLKTVEVYREATTKEVRSILRIEREVLVELGFNEDDKKNVLYKDGMIHKYNKLVNERLMNELNVVRKYTAHHMIFNYDHLEDERKYILNDLIKSMMQNGVNKAVIDRIIENAEKRNHSARLEMLNYLDIDFGEYKDAPDKLLYRSDKGYIESYNTLNEFLIDIKMNEKREQEIFTLDRTDEEINKTKELDIELPIIN